MALKISVKSKPRNLVSGKFELELDEGSIFLTKKGTRKVVIDVGTEVRYLGQNKLRVVLPEGELTLRVHKFGYAQNRLAEDIAKYIAGEGDFPILSDYAIPWPFVVISILPFGILLIVIGALPILLAIGASGVSLSVAQKKTWPLPLRVIIALAAVAVGYAIAIAIAIAISQAMPHMR